MPEHFTKTTVEAKVWCAVCGDFTMHAIADGRRGSCKACIARLEAENKRAKDNPPAEQMGLFR